MLKGRIKTDAPNIKGVISTMPEIRGRIIRTGVSLKGVVHNSAPLIKGAITKGSERESYYEVSNKYGTTIIIGD